ncbi:MAG: prepilin peptidase [Rhodobacteraceae bacterium]|nr:prepilin peptidase [Paracoccaceae bacterium]
MIPAVATGIFDPTLFSVLIAVLGLVVGSFITALSYRLPRGESIAAGRSKCPSCGKVLGVFDLIPVLSWLATRGRCRGCGALVSWRYPAIELVTMAMFLSAAILAPTLADLGLLLVVAGTLVTLGVIDLEHHRLPNALVATLAIIMSIWRWRAGGADGFALGVGTAVGVGVLAFAISALTRRSLLGPGDAKLLAAAAVGLPWWQFVVFTGITGIFATVFVLLWQARGRGPESPFGPTYAAGLWICLLYPEFYKSFAA